jgi:hypothetical protein
MTDIEKLIQKFNARRPTGGGWHMALCPFHSDQNLSLAFNSDHYTCFSCGKKGPLANLLDVAVSAKPASTPEQDRREKQRTLRTAILRQVAGLLWRALPG